MKGELVWGIASTSTCLALAVYILVIDKRAGKQTAEGKRDAYLQILCNNLHSLPNEEWEHVQAKLDVFMGLSAPKIDVPTALPPPPPPSLPAKRESPVNFTVPAAPVAPAENNDSPELVIYRKMLKMGIPEQAVRNKMMTDKIDPALLFGETACSVPAPVPVAHALAKPPVILNLESTPVDSLSQHSFWRNTTTPGAVVMDRNVSRAIKVLFHSAPKQRSSNSSNKPHGDENRSPNMAKSVLPARRAQNIQIGLIKLKRTPQELCEQINAMGISTMDDLQLLDNILPSTEEMKLVLAASGSVPVDQFVLCVAKQCKDAKQRVRCMMFVQQNTCEDVAAMVTEMTSFCALVLAQSAQFATLLEAVRLVACALNRTSKQSKEAISIHALGETLVASKTRNSKFTVAHLVVAQFNTMQDNNSTLVEAFNGGVMQAQFPALAAVEAQVRVLAKEIGLCEQYNDALPQLDDIKQQFAKVNSQLQSLKDTYSCLLEVFGERADRAFTDFYQDIVGLVRCVDLASDCTSQVLGVLANALE